MSDIGLLCAKSTQNIHEEFSQFFGLDNYLVHRKELSSDTISHGRISYLSVLSKYFVKIFKEKEE